MSSNNSKQAILQAVSVLSKSKSVVDAANLLNLSTRQLRRMFLDAGMLSPASYLPFTEIGLTKSQKKRIRHLYSEFGGENTASEIAELLQIPVAYIQEYIKQYKITHASLPLDEEEMNQVDDSDKIKKLLEVKNYKIKAKLETLEAKRASTDAEKWRTWKETVGTELFELLARTVPKYEVTKVSLKRDDSPFAAVWALQDFHFGRLASSMEVNEDTDMDIQEKDLFDSVNRVLNRMLMIGLPDKLYITTSGDFLNIDTPSLTTTKNTNQDNFPSLTVTTVKGALLSVKLIDYLRQYFSFIEFVPIFGNHDQSGSLSLYMFLSAWYKDVNDVITNFDSLNFRDRQYRVYGKTLIAITHGDKSKAKDMPGIITQEARHLLATTTHTIVLQGHNHNHINTTDIQGMTFIQVPSLAKEDRWHYGQGYQSRKGISFALIDKETGYMGEILS